MQDLEYLAVTAFFITFPAFTAILTYFFANFSEVKNFDGFSGEFLQDLLFLAVNIFITALTAFTAKNCKSYIFSPHSSQFLRFLSDFQRSHLDPGRKQFYFHNCPVN